MANRVLFDINGVKVSQPGVNVLLADRKQLLFDSKDRAFNVATMGIVSSYPSWSTWSSTAQYCDILHGYSFVGLPSALFVFDYGHWRALSPYEASPQPDPEDYRNGYYAGFNRIMAIRAGDSQYIPGIHIAFQGFSACIMSDRIRFFRSSICVIQGEYHTFGAYPTLPPVKYALIETGL